MISPDERAGHYFTLVRVDHMHPFFSFSFRLVSATTHPTDEKGVSKIFESKRKYSNKNINDYNTKLATNKL